MTLPVAREGQLDIDGPLRYLEWDGPDQSTFVLVHGLGGSALSWTLVAPGLAERARILAPDLPGFGRTPLAGRQTSLPALRRTLAAFLEEKTDGPVTLFGNSMGGAVSLFEAAVEPARIRTLVLTDPALPWLPATNPSPIVRAGLALYRIPAVGPWVVGQRQRRLSPERQVRLGLRIIAADPSTIPEDLVRQLADQLRNQLADPEAPRAFAEAARSMMSIRFRGEITSRMLDGVRCPVLILHGRKDKLVPVEWAEAAARAHPSWTLREFPDLGHVPQIESPDRWLGAVEDWLATVS